MNDDAHMTCAGGIAPPGEHSRSDIASLNLRLDGSEPKGPTRKHFPLRSDQHVRCARSPCCAPPTERPRSANSSVLSLCVLTLELIEKSCQLACVLRSMASLTRLCLNARSKHHTRNSDLGSGQVWRCPVSSLSPRQTMRSSDVASALEAARTNPGAPRNIEAPCTALTR